MNLWEILEEYQRLLVFKGKAEAERFLEDTCVDEALHPHIRACFGESGLREVGVKPFECCTLTNRFRYYETSTAFYIERVSDGAVQGIGDGVDLFWDEATQTSIPVGTPRFYEEFRVSALNEDEDELERAYFG